MNEKKKFPRQYSVYGFCLCYPRIQQSNRTIFGSFLKNRGRLWRIAFAFCCGFTNYDRLRVVSSFPPGNRRESSVERWESARKVRRGQKMREGGGWRGENEGKVETTDNPLLKNLRVRWRPQYSNCQFGLFRQQVSQHDGILSFSIVMTACSFENVFKKIGTTAIFNMLDLENLPQKKLGLFAVCKKSTDPLDV